MCHVKSIVLLLHRPLAGHSSLRGGINMNQGKMIYKIAVCSLAHNRQHVTNKARCLFYVSSVSW